MIGSVTSEGNTICSRYSIENILEEKTETWLFSRLPCWIGQQLHSYVNALNYIVSTEICKIHYSSNPEML